MIDEAERDAARRALCATELFSPMSIKAAPIVRLPGLTNRVYKVEVEDRSYCLRIPGPGTAAIIDRETEAFNARAAAKAGIAPEVLYFGPDGVQVTPLIGDAVALSAERFRADPGAIRRAAQALRRLHECATAFAGVFDPFAVVQAYVDLLRSRGAAVPTLLAELMHETEQIRVALARHPAAARPCHCDPTGANLLDDGERVWLIDWEYSGMNDPAWDLAYLSIQSDFDTPLDQALLTAYFGRGATPAEASRVAVYQAPVELLSAAWALVQDSGGNRTADFRGYAARTLARCLDRMRAPSFTGHLATLRQG